MWQNFSPEIRDAIERNGAYNAPTEYGDEPYTITRKLIEEGRNHLLLDEPIALHCPVHLIHGQQDADVPWQHSLRTAEQLRSDQVAITLIKDGDHRLSRDQDLTRLCRILDKMCEDRP
jgi:pimeloyl-ACP methyl ester carboxylesterase